MVFYPCGFVVQLIAYGFCIAITDGKGFHRDLSIHSVWHKNFKLAEYRG